MDLIDYAFCPFGALKLMILIFGVTPRNEKLADSTDQMAGFFETDPGAYTFFGGLQVDEDPTVADSNTTTEMKNFYSGVAVQESRHFYVTSFTDGELGKFKAAIITPSPTPTATPSPTPSPTPIQDASNTGGTVPAQLAAGYTHPATLTMTNTGESVWTSPSGYSLAVQSDSCNLLLGATRIGMPGNPTINPGQSVIFDLNLKAPASNGPCTLQVQMVQEFVTFFGQTVTVNPTVVSPVKDSQFISHTIPATMAPNQGLQVGVTIRNLGNMVWRPGGRFILDEVSDACGLLQGPVGPVDNVHPNQTQQFFPYLTAPGSPQSCHLELRMHEDIGVAAIKDEQLFGNPPVPFGATFALDIQIQTPPNASHLWEIYQ